MKKKVNKTKYVYRYTSFSRLLEIIVTQRLPLLNALNSGWKDKIDVGFIKACEESKKKIGVLCFTNDHATSFHWDSFAKDDGVRIAFKRNRLEKNSKEQGFLYGDVSYNITKKIKHFLNDKLLEFKELVFLKRIQYEKEDEWRIVCEKEKKINSCVVAYLPIKLSDIESVTFSPYYKDVNERRFLRKTLKAVWKSMGGEENELKIYRSTLFENHSIEKLLENNGVDEINEVD